MKKLMILIVFAVTAVSLSGCKEEENKEMPAVYKGLETPPDRSKSKEF
ncbi:MAG: entry exclusion lipoprotein TrbK [Thiopseudomonas sp.]|nr:entry exclusion lipoprotein TrbK [Thiopseudomonas sp.]MCK9466484.1 entry exclusion lipoprotein TrbK [Thiopseudomonas sp.]